MDMSDDDVASAFGMYAPKTITMDARQTAIYFNGPDDVRDRMMQMLRDCARMLSQDHGDVRVEIRTDLGTYVWGVRCGEVNWE